MNRPVRRAVPIATLAALAAVPALGLAGLWQYAEANVPPPTTTTTTTTPPPPEDGLTTPLFSYRRHPAPLAEDAAAAEEAAAEEALVAGATELIPAGSCLRIADARAADDAADAGARDATVGPDGAVTVGAVASGSPVIPASNMKLVVAAVALDVLGADHRFTTELLGPPPVDGVVVGDVYLVGGGDPVLRTADVDDPLTYPAFNTTDLEPLADQIVAQGITTIDGDVVGDGSRYDDEFRVPSWGDDITNRDAGPYDALLVNDGLIGNGNYGLEPNRAAARIFYDLLAARGVTITGSTDNRARPAGLTSLAAIESLPLVDVLVEMLHTSDNNTAELMVKEIGFVASGEGSRIAGLQTVWTTLGAWGVPLEGVDLEDGSGLSRENRLTCDALTAVLTRSPVADELREVLPVAGRDGTLADQLLDTPAEGEMVAKTGTLTGVKALTGTQPGADDRPVDVAVVLNGEGVDEPAVYQPIWTVLVDVVDEYPIVVEPDDTPFEPR